MINNHLLYDVPLVNFTFNCVQFVKYLNVNLDSDITNLFALDIIYVMKKVKPVDEYCTLYNYLKSLCNINAWTYCYQSLI